MHVLVIGGTRFVGHRLVWRLLAGGHRVTLFNRGTRSDPFGARVERLVGDRTTQDLGRLLHHRRFDAAVDFAAFTGADARTVASALAGGVGHYVFISSGQVYLVRQKCPWPARELDYEGPLLGAPAGRFDRENWVYGVQKRDAEDVLAAAWTSDRFPSTRLRIPMVNGERDYFRRIEGYLWRLLDGGPILVPDGGTRPMRHVYGGEVARAIVGLLGTAATFGQAYNLSQDEDVTLVELLGMLGSLLGATPALVPIASSALRAAGLDPVEVSPLSDPWMSRLDPGRAKAELGFHHEPLRAYLDKIVTGFVNQPPAEPPAGYAQRDVERRLAARA